MRVSFLLQLIVIVLVGNPLLLIGMDLNNLSDGTLNAESSAGSTPEDSGVLALRFFGQHGSESIDSCGLSEDKSDLSDQKNLQEDSVTLPVTQSLGLTLAMDLVSKTLPNGKQITKKLLKNVFRILEYPMQVSLANNDDGSLLHVLYYMYAPFETIQQFAQCYSNNESLNAIAADAATNDAMGKTLITFKHIVEKIPSFYHRDNNLLMSHDKLDSLYGFNPIEWQHIVAANFSHNNLHQSFFRLFSICANLKSLDVSYNHITQVFDDEWRALPASLEELNMMGNKIKELPDKELFSQKLLKIFIKDRQTPSRVIRKKVAPAGKVPASSQTMTTKVQTSTDSQLSCFDRAAGPSRWRRVTKMSYFCFIPWALLLSVPSAIIGEAFLGCIGYNCLAAACTSPIGHSLVAGISCVAGTAAAYQTGCTDGDDCSPATAAVNGYGGE
jgi:hypothetical protein